MQGAAPAIRLPASSSWVTSHSLPKKIACYYSVAPLSTLSWMLRCKAYHPRPLTLLGPYQADPASSFSPVSSFLDQFVLGSFIISPVSIYIIPYMLASPQVPIPPEAPTWIWRPFGPCYCSSTPIPGTRFKGLSRSSWIFSLRLPPKRRWWR